MIADSVKNLSHYKGLTLNIDEAVDWLLATDLAALEAGTILIRGEEVRAIVQEYETVEPAGRQYEAHRAFIDIQYVIGGIERMLVAPASNLVPAAPYDPENDIIFFDQPGPALALASGPEALAAHAEHAAADLTVPADHFAIFFPQDAHIPMLQLREPSRVKKVVVKVAV